MNGHETTEDKNIFASNPKVAEHCSLLREIGVFDHIDSLESEIKNYKGLFDGALDILGRIAIEDVIDAAARKISDRFTPSLAAFLWTPPRRGEDVVITSYKNHEPFDLNFKVENISAFESFFRENPGPVNYEIFSAAMSQNDDVRNFDSIEPGLAVPLADPSGFYGLLLMGRKTEGDDYSETEIEAIGQLVSLVSRVIQNHLGDGQPPCDEKAGLCDNSGFLARLDEEIARTKHTESGASVIMMDVDNFKDFNDTYGRAAGDLVLEGIAAAIKQGVRAGDLPSRFGGEEFAVLLPNTTRDQAWLTAERLRNMAQAMKIPREPPLPQVTLSLGVVSFGNDPELPAEEIIRRAEEALYLSKERGGNRTTVWGAGLFDKIRRMMPAG